jgi:ketosteroid isomerase-like protein
MPRDEVVAAYCRYFETLAPSSLMALDRYFAPQARFCDPFNDVRGIDAIRRVFEHMYATTESPRFAVKEWVRQGDIVYLQWRFDFTLKGKLARPLTIHGLSRVRFNDDGLVSEHVDYWDPAGQLYQRLPWIGRLFAGLRRRLAAPPSRSS